MSDLYNLKQKILNSPTGFDSEIPVVHFVNMFHEFSVLNGFGRYSGATLFEIVPETYRIFNLEGVIYCITGTSYKDYYLIALPISEDINKVSKAIGLCQQLDIKMCIFKKDYEILRNKTWEKPSSIMDCYTYDNAEIKEYVQSGASRSTRKALNRFDKRYRRVVITPSEVTDSDLRDIRTVNDDWFIGMKNSDDLYSYLLHNTEILLSGRHDNELAQIKARLVIYYNDKDYPVAYDYFEMYKGMTFAVGGKAAITSISPFKSVNINISNIAKEEWNCDVMDIGGANNDILTGPNKGLEESGLGLTISKSSLPHTLNWLYMYNYTSTTIDKIEEDKSDSNALF